MAVLQSSSITGTLSTTGVITISKTGTLITHSGMSDAIGYNASYGTYIGSPVGGTYYIYANGQMNNNGSIVSLVHSGNVGSHALPISGGTLSGNLNISSGGSIDNNFTASGATAWRFIFASAANPEGFGVGAQGFGIYRNGLSNYHLMFNTSGDVTAPYSMRAPIFYDSQNTAFYLDAASTSNLNSVTYPGSLTYTGSAGSYALNLATNDGYASMRVISNNMGSAPFNDGMYIGYANASSGITRIFGGGATSGGISVNGGGANDVRIAGNIVWHQGNLTNLNQLSNGPGYITQSTGDGRYFFDYGFTEGFPGTNANNMPGNRSAFTYSNNAPYTGPIAHFGAAGYGLQLNANYGDGTLLGYRVRNGDNATWGSWRRLVWEGGTWSFSITGNAGSVNGRTVGNSTDNIAYFDSSRNLYVNSPESYSGEVRLGAAWGRGGIYTSGGLSLSTGSSFIDFVFSNTVPTTMNSSGAITFNNFNTGGIRVTSSGTGSAGAAFAIQQVTAEGWTGVFVDFEPNTGWGLYHDNPSNYFLITSETTTGAIGGGFTVPSRSSGNRTAYVKHRFDQNNGDLIVGRSGSAQQDFRAPIFYDSENTGFYLDPNSTSNLNQLTTNTRARWGMARWWSDRSSITSDQNHWTGTHGWGVDQGNWDNAWKSGFAGWDIWGSGTAHPQGGGYIHAQGIVSGQHYATSDGGTAYGWMMVGAHNATENRYWLRGKWAGSTSGWVEMITTGNIGSQSVNYANSAGSVSWGNVSSKPADWLNTTNLIADNVPGSTVNWIPSGFYQNFAGVGNPTGTWFNYINVRHSNPGNNHGFQIGMSYYDNNLWFRSYQGSGSAQSWSRALATQTDPIPANMDQYVRTVDNVNFNSIGIPGGSNTPINITGAAHKYLTINPGNGYEAMVRYIGGSGSSWYVGKRTSQTSYFYGTITTGEFQFYSEETAQTVLSVSPQGGLKNVYRDGMSFWFFQNDFASLSGGTGPISGTQSYYSQPFTTWYLNNGQVFGSLPSQFFSIYGTNMELGNYNNGEFFYYNSWDNGNLYIGGTLYQNWYSDQKYKENVVVITDALDKLDAIRGVEFDWNELGYEETGNVGHEVGVIAQEVQAVYPHAVREVSKERFDHVVTGLVVDYEKIIPLLIQSVKELKGQVADLKTELLELKNQANGSNI